jgi:hypothetical protein
MKAASALSHWIDETMPERVRETLIHANVDAGEFQQRIGPLIGIYRSDEHVENNMPQKSEEADFVRVLSELLAKVAGQMTPGALPPRTDALLTSELHFRMGESWSELRARVLNDLQTVQAALPIVGRRLRAQPARRGPKTKRGRGELLTQVENEILRQLGPPKKAARILALEVLRGYKIGAPSPDQKYPEKAAARVAKKKHRS